MAASAPNVSTTAPPRRRTMASATLVVAGACEVEARDLERWDARGGEEELAGQDRVAADHLDVRQRLEDGLGEPEVLDRIGDLAVLDHPGPVAGHPRDRRFDGMDDIGIVELGD